MLVQERVKVESVIWLICISNLFCSLISKSGIRKLTIVYIKHERNTVTKYINIQL